MAQPDCGPLLDEHLDELELIVRASENDGRFEGDDRSDFEVLGEIMGWHDRHDRQLLEAARWALAHGWQRQ
jgi:hypothetical protein